MPATPDSEALTTAMPPVTLALDTATPFLTLALRAGDQFWEVSREVGRAHAELLPDAAAALFEEAGLPFAAQCIVLGTGPGSYTGVRVGASYALGLARVWGARLLGVTSLVALVDPQQSGLQAVALDARKGQVYAATFGVQAGRVTELQALPAKLPAEEASALSAIYRQDIAPSGKVLLEAGESLGQEQWELAYL